MEQDHDQSESIGGLKQAVISHEIRIGSLEKDRDDYKRWKYILIGGSIGTVALLQFAYTVYKDHGAAILG